MRLDLLTVTDPSDERLADYVSLTDVALRSRHEPAKGLYIAESSTVLERALRAGHRPRSVLLAPRWVPDLERMVASLPSSAGAGGSDEPAVPVYVADEPVLEAITGFHVHRGALAAMHRPPLPDPAELLAGARRVAVLEDIVDHTNVGAAFRSAAALGVNAVLVTPRCADPLYRRSVRVSMGTVFQVPWTRVDPWPAGVETLREAGFVSAALALSDDAITLDDLVADLPDRLALVLGAEGHGLKPTTVAACDLVVRIPMAGGVDSLNVAAAAAVAFWATRAAE
ncbi:TrmH family RNA methyltransferase [Cellulomonas palmilytica]|uniref:TrmH family RNA methyltransferase n=1 Tax=Cellulomonas palmilytica TaxID=2608402 RepID=UPI001F23B252|nr:RNA methyltransferase [Cellulomonas palmilytica]UJP38860.1 RNA methyltransferase [Cellulomonas palmilytica]